MPQLFSPIMTAVSRVSSLFALLVVATIVCSAYGAGPTCANCKGSVLVTWPNSNCSGGFDAASSMVDNQVFGGVNANNCTGYQGDDELFFKWRCSGNTMMADQFFSRTCSGNAYTSIHIAGALCVTSSAGTSSAYFCSAAAAAAATTLTLSGGNGTVPAATPLPATSYVVCPGNKCPKGYLTTSGYFGTSCSGSVIQRFYNPQTQLGVCFKNSELLSTQSVLSGGNLITNSYYGGGCGDKALVSAYFSLGNCIGLSQGVSAKYSAASSLAASLPLLALASVLLAFYGL